MNTTTTQKSSIFNLFYIFFCIVWHPLQMLYLHVDAMGRTTMILSTLAFVINLGTILNRKNALHSSAFVCWTLLVLFSLFNVLFKGIITVQSVGHFLNRNFWLPYVFLCVVLVELGRDKYKCLRVISLALCLFVLLGVRDISFSSDDRSLSESLGNTLPLVAVGLVFVLGVLLCNQKLKGGGTTFWIITAFVLLLIIVSATRKALGAFLLVLIGVVLGRSKTLDVMSVFRIVVIGAVLLIGMNWVMDNTLIGERMAGSSEKYDVPLSSNPIINKFLMSLLGDRAIQYYYAFELFHEHPITGIGLGHFHSVQDDVVFRLHSEYMTHLCENGIIGFSLLLFYYLLLIFGLNKQRKRGENVMVYLFGLFAVLFINFTAWTYNALYIMVIYAILINKVHTQTDAINNTID